MNIHLNRLIIRARKSTEFVDFKNITFVHGPVSTGKSSIARLVDYCLGGDLERTPAIQREFVAVELKVLLGVNECIIERSAEDNSTIRVSWVTPEGAAESVNAPLRAQRTKLIDAEVFNFSDLIFYLCGVTPIKVRKRSRDPESELIRLGLRDVWNYCYLDQAHLDSSFFRLEDPFRGRKSQDAMRFFTGLHSDRLNLIESELMSAIDEQRSKREAVKQIRIFMDKFNLGSEIDIDSQIRSIDQRLLEFDAKKKDLQSTRSIDIHPTDHLRNELRQLSNVIEELVEARLDIQESIAEQTALRAELITSKNKADRAEKAGSILEGVQYEKCPQCGSDISMRIVEEDHCGLCGSHSSAANESNPLELEAVRRDINDRIDEIEDSIGRRTQAMKRVKRELDSAKSRKIDLDRELQEELSRYDSAYVESIRYVERKIATLQERKGSLKSLQKMPKAIDELEEQAGSLQGRIDTLRSSSERERERLKSADNHVAKIAEKFKELMLLVGFPGVSEDDKVIIDVRNWKPIVVHEDQEWGFWDTGSGGKKTLFNVCYALAVHSVARQENLPVPSILIVDSPTKNISEDENPELVSSLYNQIYELAESEKYKIQFLLIDSDLVKPKINLSGYSERRMAGSEDAPSLISYYAGP